MLKIIRKRATYANVAMTLALVFAMTGGAYAAKKYLITNTKQISPKVLKQLKGAKGPAGPAGPEGKAGAPGSPGKDGTNGTNGTAGKNGEPGSNGKSVTVSATASKCAEGGVTVEQEGSGAAHEVCNGAKGVLHPEEKLAPGATETGAWSFGPLAGGESGEQGYAAIGFTIPLAAALEESQVHYVEEGASVAACPGTPEDPAAEPGNLCVYEVEQEGIEKGKTQIFKAGEKRIGFEPTLHLNLGASPSGARLAFNVLATDRGTTYGTWAVTAPVS